MPVGDYDFYQYLPSYVRFRDSRENTDADDGRPVLEKLVELIETETGITSDLITGLITNIDVDTCPLGYIDYLAWLLGEQIPGGWSDTDRREFLRVLADLLKLKGTHQGFEKRAAFAGEKAARLIELFKHELYEQYIYSRTSSSYFPYKSARVDVARVVCDTSCESFCEYQQELDYLTPKEGQALIDEIGETLPIHVLVRKLAIPVDISDQFSTPADSIAGCLMSCQVYCEAGCEEEAQVYGGSECQARIGNSFPTTFDTFLVTTVCVSYCESACQTCCECGEEGTCETVCETTCQVTCEDLCQEACMVQGCQTDCQSGSCQEGCQTSCQDACESGCEPMLEEGCTQCETACQAACEAVCQVTCETVCQDACELECQTGCTTACELAVQT